MNDIAVYDHGANQIDLRMHPVITVIYPEEVHHNTNGSSTDNPAFAIVANSGKPKARVAALHITIEELNAVLEHLGYTATKRDFNLFIYKTGQKAVSGVYSELDKDRAGERKGISVVRLKQIIASTLCVKMTDEQFVEAVSELEKMGSLFTYTHESGDTWIEFD